MAAYRHASIKRKLTLLVTASTGLALVVTCLAFLAVDASRFYRGRLDDGRTLAALIGSNSQGALIFDDAERATRVLSALKSTSFIKSAAVYRATDLDPLAPSAPNAPHRLYAVYPRRGPRGSAAQSAKNPQAMARPEDPTPVELTRSAYPQQGYTYRKGFLLLYHPIQAGTDGEPDEEIRSGTALGTVFLQVDLSDIYWDLLTYFGIGLTILVLSSLVALAVSQRLQRSISDPVLALAATSQQIAEADDYTLRAVVQYRDEVGFLVHQFNRMLDRIETQKAELLAVNVQLAQSEQAARAATEAKSEFLANMSHELRTPLNAIIGFAEILVDQKFGELNARQARYINNILNSGRHLLQLINDILDLAKVEAGRLELRLERFPVTDAISSVASVVNALAGKKQILVSYETGPDLPAATADQAKYKQVLFNLLSNAIKYTPDGGKVWMTTRLAATPDGAPVPPGEEASGLFLYTSVRDSGIGIKPEDQHRLFIEFQQLDASYARQQQGTGLGLALTKRLVELHGGRIWMESEGEGQGSTFFFTIPVTQPGLQESPSFQVAPALSASSSPHASGAAAGVSSRPASDGKAPSHGPMAPPPLSAAGMEEAEAERRLVLVVEDDREASELLRHHLTEGGYRVAQAFDAETGIRMAEQLRPYAITLDLVLQERSGLEVLTRLKAAAATRAIPVVIISTAEDRQVGLAMGAVEYLVKPIKPEQLQAVLAEVVNGQGAVRSALVIDDDPQAIELVAGLLRDQGYTVLGARSGKEGLELAAAKRPGLIILDLLMPEMSGFEVLQRLREQPETAETPVVVFTAEDLTEEQRRRLRAGAGAVVSKSSTEGLLRVLAQGAGPRG